MARHKRKQETEEEEETEGDEPSYISTFSVVTRDGWTFVKTPFLEEFRRNIKLIEGWHWLDDLKCWVVPEEETENVRALMRECYGRDDSEPEDYVNIKLIFEEDLESDTEYIFILARCAARAFGGERGRKTWYNSTDMWYTSGGAERVRHGKMYCAKIPAGSELVMKFVPKVLFDQWEPLDGVKVLIGATGNEAAELIAEREKLYERIREINDLLAE